MVSLHYNKKPFPNLLDSKKEGTLLPSPIYLSPKYALCEELLLKSSEKWS